MLLQEFIQNALLAISGGIESAQNEMPEGFEINPKLIDHGFPSGAFSNLVGMTKSGDPILLIDFDVAITTTETDTNSAKIGVLFSSIGLGADASQSDSSHSATRIKFRVPMKYKIQP